MSQSGSFEGTVFLIRQVKILRDPPGQPPSAYLDIVQADFKESW
jgi:hypothetical protein